MHLPDVGGNVSPVVQRREGGHVQYANVSPIVNPPQFSPAQRVNVSPIVNSPQFSPAHRVNVSPIVNPPISPNIQQVQAQRPPLQRQISGSTDYPSTPMSPRSQPSTINSTPMNNLDEHVSSYYFYPTNTFTVFLVQNMSHDVSEVHKIRRSPDDEAHKF